MADDLDGVFDESTSDRRAFLRRLVIGAAFVVPAVSSFSMAGLGAAYAGPRQGPRNSNQIHNSNQDCHRPGLGNSNLTTHQ